MSTFGIIHTAISVLPIGFGAMAFIRDGKIDPRTWAGKAYLYTMLAGTVSSWGFLPTKGFTPGQVLTLITLALLLAGMFTVKGRPRESGSVQVICLSASYFLLMFFATTESLTRLPLDHPFATGPTDPALLPVRIVLLVALLAGVGYQLFKQRVASRQPLPADSRDA
jgi:hypothetical protein